MVKIEVKQVGRIGAYDVIKREYLPITKADLKKVGLA